MTRTTKYSLMTRVLRMKLQTDEKKAHSLFCGAVQFVHVDRPLTRDEYKDLVSLCADRLKMDFDAIWDCGICLLNKPATRDLIYRFCYFLVVNKAELSRHTMLLDGGYFQEETVLVRFMDMSYLEGNKISVHVKMLTGPAALKSFNITGYKSDWVKWLYLLGYGNSSSQYYISSLKACIPGLYAKLKMTAPPGKRGHFNEYDIQLIENSTITNYNRNEILKYRRCILECTHGLSEQQACEDDYCALRCPHGWKFCTGSGHEKECVKDICLRCGNLGLIPEGERCCLRCLRNDKGEEDND